MTDAAILGALATTIVIWAVLEILRWLFKSR